jgi:hydroxymethylbilane synthase
MDLKKYPIRIATRGSRLALWQANHVAELLRQRSPARNVEVVTVSTVGDRDRAASLSQLGGEGVFTREIQRAVLEDYADVTVHSLKDLPTEPCAGLTLAAVPSRASAFDALLLPVSQETPDKSADELLANLPRRARIGTGSPRRRAQLLHLRDDLQLLDVRGNIETRIEKLDRGEYDALVLAEAGLKRLGLESRVSAVLAPPLMYGAVGQGALGIECRDDDESLLSMLAEMTDCATQACVRAERRLLAALRAGCHAPLGVGTRFDATQLWLEAVVLSVDGRERLFATSSGLSAEPEALGDKVAGELVSLGAERLVENVAGGDKSE